MRIEKHDDDRRDIFDDAGKLVAFVEKERFGTHGHWRGWRHCLYCSALDRIIWAGVNKDDVYPDAPHVAWESWTDVPVWFANLMEVKAHYGIG